MSDPLLAFALKLPLALLVFIVIAYAGTTDKRIAGVPRDGRRAGRGCGFDACANTNHAGGRSAGAVAVPEIEKVTGKNTKRLDQIGGGKPGPGRKPGIPNKANGLLKDAIIQAAEDAGGSEGIVGYLTLQARKHPAAFLA